MAAPVLPDDQTRVQKTFDEAAGSVRRSSFSFSPKSLHLKSFSSTKWVFLLLQDGRVNAKELMELFNSGSPHEAFHIFMWNSEHFMENHQWALTAQYRHPPLGGSRAAAQPVRLEQRSQEVNSQTEALQDQSCFNKHVQTVTFPST